MAPNRKVILGPVKVYQQRPLIVFSSVLFSVSCPEDFDKGMDKLNQYGRVVVS